jgi:hypothetical protein
MGNLYFPLFTGNSGGAFLPSGYIKYGVEKAGRLIIPLRYLFHTI